MGQIVYAVTNGGSTTDILAMFTTRALAEDVVNQWRVDMRTYDDGWGIEEYELRDTMPVTESWYQAWASIDMHTFAVTGREERTTMYPWDLPSYRADTTPDGFWFHHATIGCLSGASSIDEATEKRRRYTAVILEVLRRFDSSHAHTSELRAAINTRLSETGLGAATSLG